MSDTPSGRAAWVDELLVDLEPITWNPPDGTPAALRPALVFLGRGNHALEVAVASSVRRPKAEDVRRLWRLRHGGRASPVLLLVGYPGDDGVAFTVCGPAGEHPTLLSDLPLSQTERLASAALAEPTHHAAIRFLVAMLPEVESDLPGLRNTGLLANQELRHGVPVRADWAAATEQGRGLLGLTGRALVSGLGFEVGSLSVSSSVLSVGAGTKRSVAVFLDEQESFEESAERFHGVSPVSHALAIAEQEGLPWVVLTRGRQIRLYSARPAVGVGRKGQAETYVEANLALLPEDAAGYIPLLFGAEALVEHGTIEEILDRSADFAADLAVRLRERVYHDTVPTLAAAVAERLGDPAELGETDLAFAYEQSLLILFRLLFVAYGEDKELLPYRSNSMYADHSLKRIARLLAEKVRSGSRSFDDNATDLWEDVNQLWRAVHAGNVGWGLPAYNGGMFSEAPDENPAGAALAKVALTDAEFGQALTAMLVDTGDDGVVGPVDFRSLSVTEFGTIYEGLLESMLSVAPTDLVTDKRGTYVPAKGKQKPEVRAGEVYFHNRSGARKATGSYFTKHFAVEHLLDHALETALEDHLDRIAELLDADDQAAAAEQFFDFRCVDLAMGSGHFLVAAVDRIERRLSNFLSLRPIPAVSAELQTLRQAALDALGDLASGVEIETRSLLRRQVARRCVYGVDLNPISVELARLAIWIHTFVPGLPLSFLDHSLVRGNSLTGIGTLDEALDVLEPDQPTGQVSLFREGIEEFLGRAEASLRRLARTTEATTADVKGARLAHVEAMAAVEPARQLFDLLVSVRLGLAQRPEDVAEAAIAKCAGLSEAQDFAAGMEALHFPIAFPEVFLRERPGFDCILGNPPWEEATVEELGFFALRQPGLKSLSQAEQKKELKKVRRARPDLVDEYEAAVAEMADLRELLLAGPYPGMGQGDPDLYKAFTWRFWQLVREDGAIGVVLPRSALSAKGSAAWRLEVLEHGAFDDVTMLLNNQQWFFEDVHPQYTIGLIAIRKGIARAGKIHLRGPFPSAPAYAAGLRRRPTTFAADDFTSWSEGASFPLIPSPAAADVFRKIRSHPRIDSTDGWTCRPTTEFHATSDKELFELDPDDVEGLWPVYKGASFNLWEPDTGTYYAWADPDRVLDVLQDKRLRSARRAKSPFGGFDAETLADPETLPCRALRIAFRDITNRTNQRTVIAALVYPEIVITNQAPYLLWSKGDERDQAYVLGVLCSIPLDWYARRVVETHVNFHLFNAFPMPRPERDDPLRREVEIIAGRLAAVDDWFADWAEAVGVEVASVAEDERDALIARLDAAVALLYRLTEEDVVEIFRTFHEGWDVEPRLAAVLDHYRELS